VAKTVHIHIGLPKTGTSLVQSVVRENRDELMDAGLLAPFRRFDSAYAVRQLAAHRFDATDVAWTARWTTSPARPGDRRAMASFPTRP
jgi:hypothetical protein